MIYLELFSSEDEKIGIRKIAAELNIPSPFLGKILQTLVKHELLDSTKGPRGGFYLKRPALDIRVMEIIEVIDGKGVFENCVIRTEPCNDNQPCSMHGKLSRARAELRSVFTTETISDLVSEFREGNERIRI